MDPVHETDGHFIDALSDDRGGEKLLDNGMSSLYAENGVDYAVDDVSGALLDPEAVRSGRATEIK